MKRKERRPWKFGIVAAAIIGANTGWVQAEEGTSYSQDVMNWEDAVYGGDTQGVYRMEGAKKEVICQSEFQSGFAKIQGKICFFVKEGGKNIMMAYDPLQRKTECLFEAGQNCKLVGTYGTFLYYLEPDKEEGENYWGRTLKAFDLSTKESSEFVENAGNAVDWGGKLIISEMASDVSPITLWILDEKQQVILLDEECSSSVAVQGTELYYWEYQMEDEVRWDSAQLICLDATEQTKKVLAEVEGVYVTPFFNGAADEKLYFSAHNSEELSFYEWSARTGKYEEREDADGNPRILQEDGKTYWYMQSDQLVCRETADGFEEAAKLEKDADLLKITDGKVFYWRYEGETYPKKKSLCVEVLR